MGQGLEKQMESLLLESLLLEKEPQVLDANNSRE
ncbi:MAG: hypothetical protein H6Q67_1694 [Firmicutes bacterium]|nr:hypothetical protein [Bacillota bacterium]